MTPNPIRRVLSSIQTSGVKSLLMGGQACILYGAAEFSRDTDLAVLAEGDNLSRLRSALGELQAECVAVPPFEQKYLEMGLAVHFRCFHPEAAKMRIDVLSNLRGLDPFHALWDRRTTLEIGSQQVEVLSLPDLVLSKKTQRDKDWPMLARLVEASYFTARDSATPEQIQFWLQELRTPSLLMEAATRFSQEAERLSPARVLLSLARSGDLEGVKSALQEEESREREADRQYWAPLREELEHLRLTRRNL